MKIGIIGAGPDPEAVARMAALPFPSSDPVRGKQVALPKLWGKEERSQASALAVGRMYSWLMLIRLFQQATAGCASIPFVCSVCAPFES